MRSTNQWPLTGRVLVGWFFGDVWYAVLPLLMLVAVTFLLGSSFAHFAELKEWSFANIVFFGAAMGRFVRLRPSGLELDVGIKVFFGCLVASVLVLSLVLLLEHGVLPAGVSLVLGQAQMALFFLGLASLLISEFAEEFERDWTAPHLSRSCVLHSMDAELARTEGVMERVVEALTTLQGADEAASRNREDQVRLRVLADRLIRTQQLVAEARSRLASAPTNPSPAPTPADKLAA